MNKYLLLSVSLAGAILSGCASQQVASFNPFQPSPINMAGYKQKTNHFLVVNDSSSSMDIAYVNGGFAPGSEPSKFNVEKELLSRMNKTIPEINLTSGLRSFGFGECLDYGSTKLNQAMTSYSKSAFDGAINTLTCNSGGTPLATALEAAQDDLASSTGKIALIIFSDGLDDVSSVPATKALKAKYGDKLCIYPVWVGNANEINGRFALNQLANIGACGFSTAAADVASPAGMSSFVQRVFLESDVPTPPKCADSDRDGVTDCEDQCPNTPVGATVNMQGCWVLKGVFFDTAKHNIKAKYYPLLNNVADVIKNNPGLSIEIQGHTDSVGSDGYNLGLSNRRATSVKDYLSKKVGNAGALSAKGYGESKPVDTNATAEGKANNRRVQLDVIK
jgi:OOP family OmpA-OmpF porin